MLGLTACGLVEMRAWPVVFVTHELLQAVQRLGSVPESFHVKSEKTVVGGLSSVRCKVWERLINRTTAPSPARQRSPHHSNLGTANNFISIMQLLQC